MAVENESTGTVDSRVDGIDWKASVKIGAAAWAAVYVVLFLAMEVAGAFQDLPQEISKTDVVSHVVFSGSLGSLAADGGQQWVAYAAYQPEETLKLVAVGLQFLLPAVVLVGAGAKIASDYEDRGRTTALVAGASVAVGYAAATVLSTALFTVPDVSYSTLGIIVAGGLYPIVFGALGAVASTRQSFRAPNAELYGAGAVLVGFVAWYLLAETGEGVPVSEQFPTEEPIEILQFVWLYVHQHGTLTAFNQAGALTGFDVIGGAPEISYGWLPAAVFVGAGYLVVARSETVPETELEAALDAATIARGAVLAVTVLTVALLGLTYAETEMTGEAFAQLLLAQGLPAVLLAGVVWPFAWGAVGGAVASYTN